MSQREYTVRDKQNNGRQYHGDGGGVSRTVKGEGVIVDMHGHYERVISWTTPGGNIDQIEDTQRSDQSSYQGY